MSPSPDQDLIETLLRERLGYVARGLPDRVAAVDAELKRLGARSPSTEPSGPAAVGPQERAVPKGREKERR